MKTFTIEQLAKVTGWEPKKLATLLLNLKKFADKQDKLIEKFAQAAPYVRPSIPKDKDMGRITNVQSLINKLADIKKRDLSIYPNLSKCIDALISGIDHVKNLINANASQSAITDSAKSLLGIVVKNNCKGDIERALVPGSNERFVWDLLVGGKATSLIPKRPQRGTLGLVQKPTSTFTVGK